MRTQSISSSEKPKKIRYKKLVPNISAKNSERKKIIF
jgi:hypothetical protein